VNGGELHEALERPDVFWGFPVKTVDEDGFVRDIVATEVDAETGVLLLRLAIQEKNGEIE
jgi:hypothetical protein